MRVLGNQRRLDRLPPEAAAAALDELLRRSDFVVLTCPLTPEDAPPFQPRKHLP